MVSRILRLRKAELDQRQAELIHAREAVASVCSAFDLLCSEAEATAAAVGQDPNLLILLSDETLVKGAELDRQRVVAERDLADAEASLVNTRGEVRRLERYLEKTLGKFAEVRSLPCHRKLERRMIGWKGRTGGQPKTPAAPIAC